MSTDQTILDLALRVSRLFNGLTREDHIARVRDLYDLANSLLDIDMYLNGLTREDLTSRVRDLYDLSHALLDIDIFLNSPSTPPETALQLARDVLNRKPGA